MSHGEPSERHRADRRRGDRRRREEDEAAPQSWFGALGVGDTQWHDDAESRLGDAHRAWAQSERARVDPRVLTREARRIVGSSSSTFQRLYRAFVAARAAIGVLLVVAQGVAGLFGPRPWAPLLLCIAYATQAVALWMLPRFRGDAARTAARSATRLSRAQWIGTVAVDVAAFSLLHAIDTQSSLNYVALLVMPVLMAGILMPRVRALATAAAATLLLLATAWWSVAAGVDPASVVTQAGFVGGGLFVVTLLAGELGGRLAREELAARGSLELARQQAQLNKLVIDEMREGVLVVDRGGRVRAANPAARALLAAEGLARPAPFRLEGVEPWQPLVRTVERAFDEGQWPETGRDVTLELSPAVRRTLRVRVRFTRRRDDPAGEDVCVLFLEDVLDVQTRLRQEKLAAMGRVSAGIAHEIRNPLAAIAQANALLAEDRLEPAQARLAQMVADNVERLKRIVDDVLEVAPGAGGGGGVIDGTAVVGALASDWAATNGLRLGERCALHVELPHEAVGVRFDAEHLRRVLVNLLDNGRRHASGEPGAVRLVFSPRDANEAVLSVASDGDAIPPEVERYLFEPFFSTSSRGTGLGLYICRELCERHGARIDYRQHPPESTHRNEFVVVMRRAALPVPESRLHLAP